MVLILSSCVVVIEVGAISLLFGVLQEHIALLGLLVLLTQGLSDIRWSITFFRLGGVALSLILREEVIVLEGYSVDFWRRVHDMHHGLLHEGDLRLEQLIAFRFGDLLDAVEATLLCDHNQDASGYQAN